MSFKVLRNVHCIAIAVRKFLIGAAVSIFPKAKIDPNRIKLALEPECASIWCETLGMDVKGAESIQGAQYMVVDLGGGTADISVHEKTSDGNLKQIHKASGGPWGGIFVDENYMKMLGRLFGEKALIDLQHTEMSDYFDITREFEQKKRLFDTVKTKHFIVRVSASLRKLAKKHSKQSLEDRIAALDIQENSITPKASDKLKIDGTIIQSWFKRPIDMLIQHIRSLLAEAKMKRVQTVVLEVRVEDQVTMIGTPYSKVSLTPVYRTIQENPEYVTDPGCELIGTVRLENSIDIPFEEQDIEDTFVFGDTELLVKTKNMATGKEAFMTFECFK
ncbi:HS12B-like protein [Mya arenaria]|uniref:HS12B-like protein n=1 Tax=Mya arenaria TaxID=6604 RepID=A0ABY7FZA4_MYAAR|nr:HS12B-like protein [Mya arenaria]